MTLTPPPRNLSRIPLEVKSVKAGNLYRITRHMSGEPYFGTNGSNRFDDHSKPIFKRFGTCYLGLGLETAIAETILHDELPKNGIFQIAYTEFSNRYLVRFKRGTLELANLTGASLKMLGGNGLLSTIDTYNLPQRWAMAVHRHPQSVDGIYYMSKHLNDRPAAVIYERAKDKLAGVSTKPLLKVSGIENAVENLKISFAF